MPLLTLLFFFLSQMLWTWTWSPPWGSSTTSSPTTRTPSDGRPSARGGGGRRLLGAFTRWSLDGSSCCGLGSWISAHTQIHMSHTHLHTHHTQMPDIFVWCWQVDCGSQSIILHLGGKSYAVCPPLRHVLNWVVWRLEGHHCYLTARPYGHIFTTNAVMHMSPLLRMPWRMHRLPWIFFWPEHAILMHWRITTIVITMNVCMCLCVCVFLFMIHSFCLAANKCHDVTLSM